MFGGLIWLMRTFSAVQFWLTNKITSCLEYIKPIDVNNGTVPVIGLYEVKVGKMYEALNKNF